MKCLKLLQAVDMKLAVTLMIYPTSFPIIKESRCLTLKPCAGLVFRDYTSAGEPQESQQGATGLDYSFIEKMAEASGFSTSVEALILTIKVSLAPCKACIQIQANHPQNKFPCQPEFAVPKPKLIIEAFSKIKKMISNFMHWSWQNRRNFTLAVSK